MFRIPGKIPIVIHPIFWPVAFLLGYLWTLTLPTAFISIWIILGSVLLHELGHATTSLIFGQKARIEISFLGGFTYREGQKLSLAKEFLIVLAGPLMSFFLSMLALVTLKILNPQFGFYPLQLTPLWNFALHFTFLANLFWTIINLVPVMPLDGGHLLSILFEAIFGPKGIVKAIQAGIFFSILISLVAFFFNQYFILMFFLLFTFEGLRSLKYYKLLKKHDQDENLQKEMENAQKVQNKGDFEQALKLYQEIQEKTKEGVIYTLAIQQIALIYKKQKAYDKAYESLLKIENDLPERLIPSLQFLAFQNGDLKKTLFYGSKSYQIQPGYETALINALAHALLREAKPSCGWLERAIKDGIPSVNEVMTRSEFDPIRNAKEFIYLKAKISNRMQEE